MTDNELIERIIMEDDEMLIRYFCMHIGYDWNDKPEHDPAIYPKWSEITKAIWAEIKRRMHGTVVQAFDYDKAINKIDDEIDKARHHLRLPSAECSYYYGYIRGLTMAKCICVKCKRSKYWKSKGAKDEA